MINREELIRSKEYWLEKIQNQLFAEIEDFIENEGINKTQFAEKLGVSKSYLTQVLNGSFDHKLSKLIELSLAVGKVPVIKFESIDNILKEDKTYKLKNPAKPAPIRNVPISKESFCIVADDEPQIIIYKTKMRKNNKKLSSIEVEKSED